MSRTTSPLRLLRNVMLGSIALLLLLELLLQGARLLVKEHSWRAQSQWLTGHLRILALGDSNTYGLYLPAEDAYPAQLEMLWNLRHPDRPVEVINLGYPGTNSFRLLANLPDLLDTFQPDLVLLQIGFNDFWTPVETPAAIESLTPIKTWLLKSRLYQLYFMWFQKRELQHRIDSGERMLGGLAGQALSETEISYLQQASGLSRPELLALTPDALAAHPALKQKLEGAIASILEQRQQAAGEKDILHTVKYGEQVFSLGIAPGASAGNSKQMTANIRSMLTLLEQRNVPYLLMNYPTRFGYYPAANKKIATLVSEQQVPFVDLQGVLHPDCQKKPDSCPELLFYDAHATAKGNQLLAEHIAQELEAYLLLSSPR